MTLILDLCLTKPGGQNKPECQAVALWEGIQTINHLAVERAAAGRSGWGVVRQGDAAAPLPAPILTGHCQRDRDRSSAPVISAACPAKPISSCNRWRVLVAAAVQPRA